MTEEVVTLTGIEVVVARASLKATVDSGKLLGENDPETASSSTSHHAFLLAEDLHNKLAGITLRKLDL